MPDHPLTIDEMEKSAGQRILAVFPQVKALTQEIYDLGRYVVFAWPETNSESVTSSDLACRYLFHRLYTDFFAISTLLGKGYGLQAATLASSSFETAFMIMYIGADNEKATKWLENDNPFKFSIGVEARVKEVLENSGLSKIELKSETERLYSVYRNLSGAKHVNIHTQGLFQFVMKEEEIGFVSGPDYQDRGIWIFGYTFQSFASFFIMTAQSIADSHISKSEYLELIKMCHSLILKNNHFNVQIDKFIAEADFDNPKL